MTKTLKNTLIILLSALLVFSCAILLLPRNVATAYAEETNKTPIVKDGNFEIEDAKVDTNAFARGRYVLNYGVTLKNTDYTKLSNKLAKTVNGNIWNQYIDVPSEVKFTFTLYRNDIDGNQEEALVSYVMWFKGYGGRDGNQAFGKVLAKKELTYYPEEITFGDKLNPIDEYKEAKKTAGTYNDRVINALKKDNYEILSFGTTEEGFPVSSVSQTVPFIVETDSPNTNYHVEFELYEYEPTNDGKITNFNSLKMTGRVKANLEREGQCVQSQLLSWKNEDATGFEETFGLYGADVLSKAIDVATNAETLTITVKYLEQIGETPFAEAKYKTVNVKAFNGIVTETDVLSALDISTFKCLESYGTTVLKEDDVWRVKYLHCSHLSVTAPNGRSIDYFFDINSSFYEFFDQYVKFGANDTTGENIIPKECIEYVLNEIGRAYPELAFDEQQNLFDYGNSLYGCWGWVQIPVTVDIDTLFKEVFNVKTATGVQSIGFSQKTVLSKEQYSALIKQPNYTMFEQFWYDVTAGLAGYEATTYIMVMQPGVNWINQTGKDAPPSYEDPGNDGLLGGFLSGVADKLKQGWNSFIGIFDFLTATPGRLAGTMGVLAGGVLLVVLIKTGALKNIGGGRRRQRAPRQKQYRTKKRSKKR